jgi:hypothetical protein
MTSSCPLIKDHPSTENHEVVPNGVWMKAMAAPCVGTPWVTDSSEEEDEHWEAHVESRVWSTG